MPINLNSKNGKIEISNDVIANVVGRATTHIFGIVGMARKSAVKDGLNEILNRENYSRGVRVRQDGSNVAVDVYVIVSYGTKISEVSKNVQERVRYEIKQVLGIIVGSVNVYVQGVRVIV